MSLDRHHWCLRETRRGEARRGDATRRARSWPLGQRAAVLSQKPSILHTLQGSYPSMDDLRQAVAWCVWGVRQFVWHLPSLIYGLTAWARLHPAKGNLIGLAASFIGGVITNTGYHLMRSANDCVWFVGVWVLVRLGNAIHLWALSVAPASTVYPSNAAALMVSPFIGYLCFNDKIKWFRHIPVIAGMIVGIAFTSLAPSFAKTPHKHTVGSDVLFHRSTAYNWYIVVYLICGTLLEIKRYETQESLEVANYYDTALSFGVMRPSEYFERLWAVLYGIAAGHWGCQVGLELKQTIELGVESHRTRIIPWGPMGWSLFILAYSAFLQFGIVGDGLEYTEKATEGSPSSCSAARVWRSKCANLRRSACSVAAVRVRASTSAPPGFEAMLNVPVVALHSASTTFASASAAGPPEHIQTKREPEREDVAVQPVYIWGEGAVM
ncbi:unnamed protein product [Vitrella brassicaformis CCMP3155]|uniref:Uncharacterized protein n=1 Tax=Vitrella brassicaformis (strain CCMP3155) TaxID=1169540 RepID=A0A0G4EZ22_VITBC|nr:unnamed protein product [Vitrella brassicaformis CCMP3155]|eukprot:CEM04443.1 unnamed protein product [Vitrella brassicaformis CCMP3155]